MLALLFAASLGFHLHDFFVHSLELVNKILNVKCFNGFGYSDDLNQIEHVFKVVGQLEQLQRNDGNEVSEESVVGVVRDYFLRVVHLLVRLRVPVSCCELLDDVENVQELKVLDVRSNLVTVCSQDSVDEAGHETEKEHADHPYLATSAFVVDQPRLVLITLVSHFLGTLNNGWFAKPSDNLLVLAVDFDNLLIHQAASCTVVSYKLMVCSCNRHPPVQTSPLHVRRYFDLVFYEAFPRVDSFDFVHVVLLELGIKVPLDELMN